MIAEAPKNGWLLYAPATGEFQLVSGPLDNLAHVAQCVFDRTKEKFPDVCIIHCFELGRKRHFVLRPVVERLEPLEGET